MRTNTNFTNLTSRGSKVQAFNKLFGLSNLTIREYELDNSSEEQKAVNYGNNRMTKSILVNSATETMVSQQLNQSSRQTLKESSRPTSMDSSNYKGQTN